MNLLQCPSCDVPRYLWFGGPVFFNLILSIDDPTPICERDYKLSKIGILYLAPDYVLSRRNYKLSQKGIKSCAGIIN